MEAELEPKKWEPRVGDLVGDPKTYRNGKVIGFSPPGVNAMGSGWDILVKWNDLNSQYSWHDAGDLDWMGGGNYGPPTGTAD